MSYSHLRKPMVSHWSLSDSKSTQIFRTLLSVLAGLMNTVIWMVSNRHLISKFSSLCTNPLLTVLRAQFTVGITLTFMFHRFFFQFSCKVLISILHVAFFQFHSVVSRDGKFHKSVSLSFIGYHLVSWSIFASQFLGRILGCANSITSYGQIYISFTIPHTVMSRLMHFLW